MSLFGLFSLLSSLAAAEESSPSEVNKFDVSINAGMSVTCFLTCAQADYHLRDKLDIGGTFSAAPFGNIMNFYSSTLYGQYYPFGKSLDEINFYLSGQIGATFGHITRSDATEPILGVNLGIDKPLPRDFFFTMHFGGHLIGDFILPGAQMGFGKQF
jgi:hypothetical protein